MVIEQRGSSELDMNMIQAVMRIRSAVSVLFVCN